MEKDIDIIVYGATGFTGKLCVEYLASEERSTKWAIAGRNQEKLKKVADDLCPDIEILIADSEDEDALDQLTQRTKSSYRPQDHFIDTGQNWSHHV